MGKVLELIDNGFNELEFFIPYYRFQEAGYAVDVVGETAGEVYSGDHGMTFKADLSAMDVDINDYDAVVIPGGRAPDRMRIKKSLVDLVRKASDKGKVIAAICHGPQILIEADVIKGKRLTCYPSVVTDVKNAGGLYEDRSVVVDQKLVTSRKPGDLPDFCRETLRALQG